MTKHAGHFEFHVFLRGFNHLDGHIKTILEGVDDLVDQDLRRGGTRSDADAGDARETAPVNVCRALDQLRIATSGACANFNQPPGIGRIGCTDNKHGIAQRGYRLDGFLPICRGIADVFLVGADNGGEADLKRGHDFWVT